MLMNAWLERPFRLFGVNSKRSAGRLSEIERAPKAASQDLIDINDHVRTLLCAHLTVILQIAQPHSGLVLDGAWWADDPTPIIWIREICAA